MPKVREYMRTEIVRVPVDTPINEIAKLLWDNNIGSVLVFEDNEDNVLGFVDDRAIFKLIAENRNPLEVDTRSIIKKLETHSVHLTVQELWDQVQDSISKVLGIEDDDGKVVGIMRKKTLAKLRFQVLKEELGISD
ncbi:MAG TPA: CBS domain-containing protein [Candidatus Lokiarchaeia archaeon]|nr:CBS domain-containing protein [Candidatus Lokiarchaeia archaeon]